MPLPGVPRPEKPTLDSFAGSLKPLDKAAAVKPNRGPLAMHRLNPTEYAHAIRDLLATRRRYGGLLPADDERNGFDNIADVLKMSPSLMKRYLSASWNISGMAVGKY